MLERDKSAFAEIYRGICATYGREANREALRIAWGVFASFSLEQVANAYTAHVTSAKFMPSPAEIVDLIKATQPEAQRPGPDEAWAKIPRSEDDHVVWTDEMAHAWGVANNLVNPGLVEKPDWVAARMAFRDAYVRAVESARAQGRPVRWSLSRGHDSRGLREVVDEAVRLGQLSRQEADRHLQVLEYEAPFDVPRLVGRMAEQDAGRTRAFLAGLRALLEPPPTDYDLDAIRAECEARERALAAAQDQRVAA